MKQKRCPNCGSLVAPIREYTAADAPASLLVQHGQLDGKVIALHRGAVGV